MPATRAAGSRSDGGAAALRAELRALQNRADGEFLQRFFKTGPGQYGEGDRFLGIRVPQLRRLVRDNRGMRLGEILSLLQSEWHEERLMALLLMVEAYRRGDREVRQEVFDAYLANTSRINNWDLVDSSAEHIVGAHVDPIRPDLLVRLARSESLWERRIAMLATFHWIRKGDFRPALQIADVLCADPHDLIHKAVGWMLREVGNRDLEVEEEFLRPRYRQMPRTMLRYAIERFPEPLRLAYLKGEVGGG